MIAEFYIVTVRESLRNTVTIGVKWEPPYGRHYKINIDGAALDNPRIGGIGGVFRTSSGDWIIGFMENMFHTTNTLKEMIALLRGLQIAEQRGLTPLEIVTDNRGNKNANLKK